jgi:ribose transport system ATP-binding protein
MALIPEDRKTEGLMLPMSVSVNLSFAALGRISDRGIVDRARERLLIDEMIELLAIRTDGTDVPVGSLSGGNQQKVVIAKWLIADTDILIFDEPTRGIDVGAKSEIYKLLNDLARQGKAVIMISSELPEILRMSHRILVMCEGRITGELASAEATQERIMTLATQRDSVAAA